MPKNIPQIPKIEPAAALGAIEQRDIQEHKRVLDLFEKRNEVLDRIIDFDEKLQKLGNISPKITRHINTVFTTLLTEFTQEFATGTDQGERDLQLMESVRSLQRTGHVPTGETIIPGEFKMEGAHGQYVTGIDRIKGMSREFETLIEDHAGAESHPWYSPKRYKSRRAAEAQIGAATARLELERETETRRKERISAAESIAKNWNAGRLDLYSKNLSRLETILHALELINEAKKYGTSFQRVNAESCLIALERIARKPDSANFQREADTRIEQLKTAMNFEERVAEIGDNLKEIELDMLRNLAELESSVKGAVQLSKLKTSATPENINALRDRLSAAAQDVRSAYETAHTTIEDIRTQLSKDTSTLSEEEVRQLQDTIEAVTTGNIRELLTSDFSAAVLAAKQVIEELQQALRLQTPVIAVEKPKQIAVETVAKKSQAVEFVSKTQHSYQEIITSDRPRPIEDIISEDAASYEAKGLARWATEVRTLAERWNQLTVEEHNYIEQKRREGWLVIGMPSAQTQLDTMNEAVIALRPRFGQDRATANLTHFYWDHPQNLINSKNTSLVANIPRQPYFFLSQPSERPPADSCSKTVAKQKAWMNQLHTNDTHQFAIQLAEYIAAQTRLTEKAENQWIHNLTPDSLNCHCTTIMSSVRIGIRALVSWGWTGAMPTIRMRLGACVSWGGFKI